MTQEKKSRIWLEGAGVGILLTLGLTWNQLSSYHLDLYHRFLPMTTVLRAFAVDLVLACLFGAALIWLLNKLDMHAGTPLWAVLAATLVARAVSGLIAADVLRFPWLTPARAFVILFIPALLMWLFARHFYMLMMRGFRFSLLLLGCCIFWILPTMLYGAWVHQLHDVVSFSRPVAAQPKPHPRILWLLFDELSYDQTFDHREADLALPAFDGLREQSVVFSNVEPAGYFTDAVIPSIFLGRPVSAVRSTWQGQLQLRSGSQAHWEAFRAGDTVFADAKRDGLTTGIVGWWNPYCRLLPNTLDFCWQRMFRFRGHVSSRVSTLANVLMPVNASLARMRHQPIKTDPTDVEQFDQLLASARVLIREEDIDFVFIHLPVPHGPYVYNRKEHREQPGESYIDNLALADETLGLLQSDIAATPSSAMTTLIVSSDHSWRIPMWRGYLGWSAEDEMASQGRFDPRPVLMVHFPGQNATLNIQQSFPGLALHGILEQLIRKNITSREQMHAWVESQLH